MDADLAPQPERQEFLDRLHTLYQTLQAQPQPWDAALIIDKVNQYYFTGTMEDGVLVLLADGSYAYFVRRSLERAEQECQIDNLYPMHSYADIFKFLGKRLESVYLETEIVTYGLLQRLRKHLGCRDILVLDGWIAVQRSRKSPYELVVIRESGRQHQYLLDSIVPSLLKEGINEADFLGDLYAAMVHLGYQGVSRFAMFQTDMVAGQIGFGENSLYPTCFDGPGGMKGMSPAVPLIGDRQRRLQTGDLVFVDIGYGILGYHTDRTQVYMLGSQPSDETMAWHRQCRAVQRQTAQLLRPGNIPAEIYAQVMAGLSADFLENFMGYGNRRVKFLGHGVGLQVDEYPVISAGFEQPLEESMVLAIEPKRGVTGVGMVGVEDTYLVTAAGGQCLTGGEQDIQVIRP
ncbi:MAG: Xaa-Pro peptidase family protein, partial [Actinomycetia bacterium]|nr:Xaa-Pro peptidase family protein [Actinomycetes bacterium]